MTSAPVAGEGSGQAALERLPSSAATEESSRSVPVTIRRLRRGSTLKAGFAGRKPTPAVAAVGDHQNEEPPDTDTTDLDLLYAPAEGLEGEDLRRVLNEIAKQGHSRLSYAEVWGALDFTDDDPDNADNVILLYTGRSHPKPDKSAAR